MPDMEALGNTNESNKEALGNVNESDKEALGSANESDKEALGNASESDKEALGNANESDSNSDSVETAGIDEKYEKQLMYPILHPNPPTYHWSC